MKLKIKLMTLLFVLLFAFSESANFHIILVGDTFSDLKEQVISDLGMMHAQTTQLANTIGASPKISVLRDHAVSRKTILQAIDRLYVQPDDYLLFYYSGHGFRQQEKRSPWPNFYFPAIDQYIALDEVLEHLKTKKVKFGLVVADCCNNAQEEDWPDVAQFNFQTLNRKHISPAIRHLFENSQGWLVVSGSEPGEYAWATEEGGILTCALLDGLSRSEYHPSKNWATIMNEIKHKTIGIQHPQYRFMP